MNWTFFIDELEVEEPIGFSDLTIRIKRDDVWHGVFFEASTSELQFYGAGADYLKDLKTNYGFGADSTFRAVSDCGGENEELFKGKFDFRQYKEKCGSDGCLVIISVEQEGCIMTLRNRYDQKVDITNQLAFDKTTVLQNYTGLNFEMQINGQELKSSSDGNVVTEGDNILWEDFFVNNGYSFRPTYGIVRSSDIITTNLDYPSSVIGATTATALTPAAITPVLLFEDVITCFNGNFDYSIRMKGNYSIVNTGFHTITSVKIRVLKGEWPTTLTVLNTISLSNLFSASFDYEASGITTLNEGEGFYVLLEFTMQALSFGYTGNFNITFDKETFVTIQAPKLCPPTDAKVSLIHETASRVTEAITDLCLKVKSDYYGRTDSEPYEATEDGCGGLRVLTNGLRIRKATTEEQFVSLKEIFDGLSAIDNIGMCIEGGNLRIEPVEYFYQDVETIKHSSIPKSDFSLSPEDAYSIIKIGYKKWEIESLNGLDEFNSNKEFRTSLKSISNTLDQTSNFIAGGYPIENTRQQSFSDTGAADTKYDNDTFIICVERDAYGYIVEQGNILNGENMYSPETAYNWRIRPMYNLMRWWKSIAQSYINLVNSTSKLIFSSGTGNILAKGQLSPYDDCTIETVALAENDDLFKTAMQSGELPIWKPEKVQYRYPMSLKDYNLIKSNPLGYVNFQCSNNDFKKGFIENISYRVAKGEAEFTLKLKW